MRAALLLCLILPSSARAYEGYRSGKFDLNLNTGWAVPVGFAGDRMATSWSLALGPSYQMDDYVAVGIEWGFQFKHRVNGRTSGDFSEDFNADGKADRISFSSNIRSTIMTFMPFLKAGPWLEAFSYKIRPFGMLGAGLFHEWTTGGDVLVDGDESITGNHIHAAFRRDQSSNSYLGMQAGAGFDIVIDDTASVGLDLRYLRGARPGRDLQFIKPAFRVSYLFN
jgi:opacity protein-like surface antigen